MQFVVLVVVLVVLDCNRSALLLLTTLNSPFSIFHVCLSLIPLLSNIDR